MKYKEIATPIRDILLNKWDPLNISGNPNLTDEYSNYEEKILRVIFERINLTEDDVRRAFKNVLESDPAIESSLESMNRTLTELSNIYEEFHATSPEYPENPDR